MSTPLLELTDVVKHFPVRAGTLVRRRVGSVHAVDGVSLAVDHGETLGLVGETGCGKSTLARCVTGLHPVTSGSVRIDGHEIAGLGRRAMRPYRRQMQMVFQDPYGSLNPRRHVGAIIGDPFAIHGVADGDERRRRVQELMALVGLNPEHYNRFPAEFSGGQRQRIGVARALALRPSLLVCDEPVSALDVSVQAQIINLLEDLRQELGLTTLFIAHDLSVVRHVSDRVAVMYLGHVVEVAPTEELYRRPRHPYTAALLSAAAPPDPDLADSRRRVILSGEVPSPVNPPQGCRFHPRCPRAQALCSVEEPRLTAGPDGDASHLAACHFPLAPGEALT
jgi:oligopeptide/dipeptide ABC transporter ATP-binding protein